jgi:hypothetical protein
MFAGRGRWRARLGVFALSSLVAATGIVAGSAPVQAVDGPAVTAAPNSDLIAAQSNAITVNGTGYEGAQAFNGVYVGLVATDDWVPGETPSIADFIGAQFVPKQAIVAGAFQTTVTVPANAVTDPDKDYAIGTICAHACSLTERSLDASTPVTFSVPEPATAPDAPTAVAATGGVGSASVSFTAPVDNGGSDITGYSVTCSSSNGGATRSATGSASPIVVRTLTAGATYTCTATATNAVGTSPPSAASNSFVAPTTPSAPRSPASRSGYTTTPTGAIVVTYTAPASNGGRPITGYGATCTSSNGGVTKSGASSSASAGPITVAGLTTGKTYTCTAVARNVVGKSVASVATAPVILGSPVPPNGVQATRSAAGQIRVTFTNAAHNGSPITSQTATCTSSNGGVTKSGTHAGGAAAPITVTGLTAGKAYTCRVRAANARGLGQASAASNAVTA